MLHPAFTGEPGAYWLEYISEAQSWQETIRVIYQFPICQHMAGSIPMPEDSTPVIIGAGEYAERDIPLSRALPPMGIAARAAEAALRDAGGGVSRLAGLIDTLAVVRIFQDSRNRPRQDHGFGRAENPPAAVARRIGANPAHAIYGNVGGDTPQTLVNEIAGAIADGEIGLALLAGGEALATVRTALRAGVSLDWNETGGGTVDDRGMGAVLATPHELAHGIGIPVQTYPLFENAIRARPGHSFGAHLLHMGRIMAPFSRVASANPHAFFGQAREAEALARVGDDNPYICLPYPKLMNARDKVNQGAALLMTSAGKAAELGIDPAKWVYLHGCAEAREKLLICDRVNYHSSPAIRANAEVAFAMAGKSAADMDLIDLYSCFPCAVEIACAELGLATDHPGGLTVTGGLPFFGGPGNNYSMHAIATMVCLLRSRPGAFGLVTANGGFLSKHATGIYSTDPYPGKWRRPDCGGIQRHIDAMSSPEFTAQPEGEATVETWTVCFRRGVPERGIVIGRQSGDGRRFVANTPADPATLAQLIDQQMIGSPGRVSGTADGNIFTPATAA